MAVDPFLPFSPKALADLQKHSVDLYVRLAELVLQSEMRMIQAGATAFNRHKSIAPQNFRAFLPGGQSGNWLKTPWEQMLQQTEVVQDLSKDCMEIHKNLGEDIKQAVAQWHREALNMVEGEAHSTDAMQRYMNQYFQFLKPKKD